MRALKLVHPMAAPGATSVGVRFSLNGSVLSALFQVRTAGPSRVNAELAPGISQWGLWEWDVVELFVSCSRDPARCPYSEFQVSPLGQHLELEIFEPRKRFNRDYRSGFIPAARRLDEGSWDAEMRIPLSRLDWDGNPASVVGNAFAILGPPGARTYWSLFLGPQKVPDFHLPSEFRSLISGVDAG